MENNVALAINYISQQRTRRSRQRRSVVGFAVVVAVGVLLALYGQI